MEISKNLISLTHIMFLLSQCGKEGKKLIQVITRTYIIYVLCPPLLGNGHSRSSKKQFCLGEYILVGEKV